MGRPLAVVMQGEETLGADGTCLSPQWSPFSPRMPSLARPAHQDHSPSAPVGTSRDPAFWDGPI